MASCLRPSAGRSAINVGSIGLQIGVQGFRIMMVLDTDDLLNQFVANKWTGSGAGIAVAGKAVAQGKVPFTNGSITSSTFGKSTMDMMYVPDDFVEFLKLLIAEKVDYLIVDGYAAGYYGHPRVTDDLDDLQYLKQYTLRV